MGSEPLIFARAILANFTPERPLMLPSSMYASLKAYPELADMMDRAKPIGLIPVSQPAPARDGEPHEGADR